MQQYFPIRASEPSDNVILAPKSINPKIDDSKDFNEFKLYNKQYMWYKALTKKPKSTKQQISPIWQWGEDIFLKDLNGSTTFYYCWLCKKQKQV